MVLKLFGVKGSKNSMLIMILLPLSMLFIKYMIALEKFLRQCIQEANQIVDVLAKNGLTKDQHQDF